MQRTRPCAWARGCLAELARWADDGGGDGGYDDDDADDGDHADNEDDDDDHADKDSNDV